MCKMNLSTKLGKTKWYKLSITTILQFIDYRLILFLLNSHEEC